MSGLHLLHNAGIHQQNRNWAAEVQCAVIIISLLASVRLMSLMSDEGGRDIGCVGARQLGQARPDRRHIVLAPE